MGAESLRLLHLCLRRAGPSSPSSFSALASPVPASPHSLVTVLGLPSPNPTPAWPVLHPTLPSHILARSRPLVLCRLQGVLCSSLDNSVSCFLHVGGHSSRLCRLYKHRGQLSVQTRGDVNSGGMKEPQTQLWGSRSRWRKTLKPGHFVLASPPGSGPALRFCSRPAWTDPENTDCVQLCWAHSRCSINAKPVVREGRAPTGAFRVSVHYQIWEPGGRGGLGFSASVTLVTQAPRIKASPLIAMDPSGKSSCL